MRGILGFAVASLVVLSSQARAEDKKEEKPFATCFSAVGGKVLSGGKVYDFYKAPVEGKKTNAFSIKSYTGGVSPDNRVVEKFTEANPAAVEIERKDYYSFAYDYGRDGFVVAVVDLAEGKKSFLDLRIKDNNVSTDGAVELKCEAAK